MKKQEKVQLLRKFKEKPLIDNVIIPLLEKMGREEDRRQMTEDGRRKTDYSNSVNQ